MGAGGGSLGARSVMTRVPAKMSPMRLPFGEIRLQITAGPPVNIQISITPDRARKSACRKRSGPPSSDTTRKPIAILPNDRPRVAISKISGYPTRARTVKMISTAAENAESSCDSVAAHRTRPMT